MTEPQPLSLLQLRQLLAGLREDRVQTRGQGNAKLSYLAAWDVRRTLIRVFGFGGYSATLVEAPQILRMDQVKRSQATKSGQDFNWIITAMSTVSLHIPQLQATYTEAAVASQTGPDIGEVSDFAVKTSESDAFKRAAMNLGTQFGLSLYDNGSTSDVVGSVLEEHQAALLADYAKKQAERRQQPPQEQDIPDPTPQRQEGRVAPAEALFDEPDPESMDQAKDQIRGAFGG